MFVDGPGVSFSWKKKTQHDQHPNTSVSEKPFSSLNFADLCASSCPSLVICGAGFAAMIVRCCYEGSSLIVC